MFSVLFVWLLLGNFFNPLEAVIEEYLKPTVSPCEDFYQYACGKWNESASNPNTSDTLSLLDATINEKISKLLESKESHHGILEKAKTFYRSCRDLKVYDLGSFLKIVKPSSGWYTSAVGFWDAGKFDWLQTVAELRRYGVKVLLDLSIMPRWDNSSVSAIYLDIMRFQPSSKESIQSVLQKASLNVSLAEEFASLESQFAQILPSADASTVDDMEEVTFSYIVETMPQINWVVYFSTVFGQEVDPNTPIMVENLDAMCKLNQLLDTIQPNMVSNYIMIKFLLFLEEHGIENVSTNDCVRAVHQAMPLAVDHIIENHFYDHEYDQVVQDLFNYLKVEFLADVSKLYESQRDVLLFIYTKVSVMEVQIGNSDRNMTLDAVARYYEGLDIAENNFYVNLIEAFKFKVEREMKWLKGMPINIACQWTVTPSPFFLQLNNRIVVPLTMLQDTVLGEDAINKYSVLGFIIGHELLHGFDPNGVNYDYKGSMVESALTCNPSFDEQIQCVNDVEGVMSVEEKIADIGGIRLAYNAFQRSLIQNGKTVMDNGGTPRSMGQSFFIDFAQFFCGSSGQSSKSKGFFGLQDADELRVKRSIVNFDVFGKAFECPVGSAMNPEKKCRVW